MLVSLPAVMTVDKWVATMAAYWADPRAAMMVESMVYFAAAHWAVRKAAY